MSPVYAILLLCLTYSSHSAPLTCEDLLRPLAQLDPQYLEGTWALVAGSVSSLSFMEKFKQRLSSTASFSSSTNDTSITWKRNMQNIDSKCHYVSYNISLEGSSFTFEMKNNVTATFTYTSCHDCILLNFEVPSEKRIHFYLFSQRRQLEQEEIDEFKSQAACLKMPEPAVMDPNTELCPQEETTDQAAKTDEKTKEQGD